MHESPSDHHRKGDNILSNWMLYTYLKKILNRFNVVDSINSNVSSLMSSSSSTNNELQQLRATVENIPSPIITEDKFYGVVITEKGSQTLVTQSSGYFYGVEIQGMNPGTFSISFDDGRKKFTIDLSASNVGNVNLTSAVKGFVDIYVTYNKSGERELLYFPLLTKYGGGTQYRCNKIYFNDSYWNVTDRNFTSNPITGALSLMNGPIRYENNIKFTSDGEANFRFLFSID